MDHESLINAISHDIRYNDFIIIKKPISFKELFMGKDIPLVQVHLIDDKNLMPIVFCGTFKWEGCKVISLDNDSYSEDMMVYAYHFSYKKDGETVLDILVGEDF